MSLRLSEIYFDHDRLPGRLKPAGSGPATSSLHLRLDRDFEIPWPEYQSCSLDMPGSVANDDHLTWSYAAYPLQETAGQPVFILACFTDTSTSGAIYEVKADGGGILGPLEPALVRFRAGESRTTACFPLDRRSFEQVGRYQTTWEWRYRKAGAANWQSLAHTGICVYLTCSAPQAPWSDEPYAKLAPWVELLDICCELAQGARDDLGAAELLTKAINSRYGLRYDIIGGAPRYVYSINRDGQPLSAFDIGNWMDLVLAGNAPADIPYLPGTPEQYRHHLIVGCQDTAAALATMAAILGVKAEVAYHTRFGYLNYIYPIGRGKCNSPYSYLNPRQPTQPDRGDTGERTKFQFHFYVKVASRTFDSCMRAWSDDPRSEGWLANISQVEYEEMTIDRSTQQRRELNSYPAPDGTWHASRPELTGLEIL